MPALYNPMLPAIEEFTGKYRFLSNFYPAIVKYHDEYFPSVEHAYQAAKCVQRPQWEQIKKAKTPSQAKKIGRHVDLREDWESIKLEVMLECLRSKFIGPLATKLLDTGDRELVEGNLWGDRYWGRCMDEGQNHLGKLLMKVRRELRSDV